MPSNPSAALIKAAKLYRAVSSTERFSADSRPMTTPAHQQSLYKQGTRGVLPPRLLQIYRALFLFKVYFLREKQIVLT